jgi:phage FluMu gp28-like protein
MGNIAVVSTPKGKDNMFYQLCNNYLNPIDPATGEERVPRPNKLIQVHWSQVPHVKANIDELRKLFHPEEFLQEYELQFLDSVESSMFTYNFMMEKVVDQRQEPVQIIELGFLDYVEGYDLPPSMVKKDIVSKYPGGIFMGYDIAMTGDGSICGVFGITEDDTWELISYKKFRSGTDLNEKIRIVCLMAQVFNAKKLVYDSTGALGKAAMGVIKNTPIKNISKPFEFTQKSKSVGYAELRLKMEKEGFKIPNIQECIKEFSNLGINPVTGRIGAQGSHRNHDDWPSMFMMAYHGRKKGIVEPAFTFL